MKTNMELTKDNVLPTARAIADVIARIVPPDGVGLLSKKRAVDYFTAEMLDSVAAALQR